MRPLSDHDAKQWADIASEARGVFSDIDDTLTHNGALVPEAYSALCRARAAGLRIVLVTGRPAGWAEVLAALFPIDAAIAENGAVAALPGGIRVYFESEAERTAGAQLRSAALASVRRELPQIRLASDQALREIDLAFDIAEREQVPEPTIDHLVRILATAGLRTTRSSIHLHGTFSAGDKATMSARIAAQLWGEPAELVRESYLFVGDSPNDAPAFAFFRHAIGVANIRDHLPRLAALCATPWAIASAESGLGFAEIIDRLLAARDAKS